LKHKYTHKLKTLYFPKQVMRQINRNI